MDEFWSWETGTIKENMSMLRKMTGLDIGDLGLEEWMPPLGPYTLTDEVGMGIIFVTLRLSPRKERYAEHLQWDSMGKSPTTWE